MVVLNKEQVRMTSKGGQRGFVRGVGIQPSGVDRQNKRKKAAEVVSEKNPNQAEVEAKLEAFKISESELYGEARRFAARFGAPEQRENELMLKWLEDALKSRNQTRREDALVEKYQSSRVSA